MSKSLTIAKVSNIENDWNSVLIQNLFEKAPWHKLNHSPWNVDFPYFPKVEFQIVHSDQDIVLRYHVEEEFVKAQYMHNNENVWEDSCVEFFLSLDNRKTYYNIEFNVLGAGVTGYGTSVKTDRQRLDIHIIDQIRTYTEVCKIDGKKKWSITLAIPKLIFGENIKENRVAHANFYKCGDGLPKPHFLAWNNIENPTPNFHLPQYFGEVIFE